MFPAILLLWYPVQLDHLLEHGGGGGGVTLMDSREWTQINIKLKSRMKQILFFISHENSFYNDGTNCSLHFTCNKTH